ncbi:glycosyltransferase family 39 protein [Bradyrhizobium sp. CER78]|uniref:glycosyltransferase family 39 protein n=1 Tax=Bradyrhizobium sp. CER78 TaxID=3039162 RepID=UPI00244D672E|nr:glycosyltransferase family 39 protein [Bradyrhizobium sp. CER78]MDH2383909.1 glycosyltransferase family 39 protein [Bradyrhizobium sp. CER78]
MPVDFALSAMAKRSDRDPAYWRRPFTRWLEGVEAGWSVPLLLAGFVGIWTLYLAVAYHGAGLHPDVLETWTYGRHFAWGYPKHPPLMGWVTGAWTSVFPLTDWSLQLMAMTNAALALWFVDLIARRFVCGHKRLLVLLLLMLTPAYQFHAQRFNANAVLLAVWPLATYCFLRAFETRAPLWAIAAGLTASLAMLGKYYSIFLVASFALSAIIHPARRAYFSSSSPWISTAAGLLALFPHLQWLAETGAEPVYYAATHVRADFLTSLQDAANFLLGLAAAVSLSAVTWVMIAGYRIRRLARDFAVSDLNLKLLWHIAIGTIVLPFTTSIFLCTDLPSLWALQGLFLLAVPMVCSTRYRIERFYTVNAALLVAGIAIVAAVIAAPIHAFYRNSHGYEEGRSFYHQAADELTRLWHEEMATPLSIVGGNDSLGLAVAFYSSDHPYYGDPFAYQYSLALPRQVTPERGWAALCFDDQDDCVEWTERMAAQAGHYVRREISIQSSLFGIPGVRRNLVAFLVAPLREPGSAASSLATILARARTHALARRSTTARRAGLFVVIR